MRTTLELDDRLHEVARRRAFDERRSLGDVISELALRGLQMSEQRPARRLGLYIGRIHTSEDFNETPADVIEALDEPLQ
jgi:hypothetical protein